MTTNLAVHSSTADKFKESWGGKNVPPKKTKTLITEVEEE